MAKIAAVAASDGTARPDGIGKMARLLSVRQAKPDEDPMGSVVQLARRRPAVSKPKEKSAREAEESHRSLIVLVGTFTFAAVAMSIAVVIAGSDSWAEAVPMILCVVVFALLKVVLADAAFFGMLKADQASERKEAARQKLASAPGSILRRPPRNPRRQTSAAKPPIAVLRDRRGSLAPVLGKHPNGPAGNKR